MAYLSMFLAKHYRHEYWLDIRDYTYEWFFPYRIAMKYVIEHSYTTAISSNANR